MRILRPYQVEALLAIRRELEKVASTLCVMPTGTGKTVLLARLIAEWGRGNALVLAHRVELLEQARDKLAPELGYAPVIEQAQRGMDMDCLWQGGAVLIGSVQTMRNDKRLEKFKDHPFDLIIVDEAHHATAPSYRKITEYFLARNPSCRIVGVTATPKRGDNAALGTVFTTCAYQYPVHQAIEDGWLVPVRQKAIAVENIDFSGVRVSKNEFGEADFNQGDLEAVLTEEEPLHALAGPILLEIGDKPCVVFTAGVAHAHLLAGILTRGARSSTGETIPGRPAAALDGDTSREKRAQVLQDFVDGKVQIIANCNVLTEGWDCPIAAVVAMGRPTRSFSTYTQMLGRVLRPLDGIVDGYEDAADRRMAILRSDKPNAWCLDFVGNSQHRLVSVMDVLGGHYDLETIEKAKERPAGPGDVLAELRKVRAEILLEKEQQARRNIKAAVTYTAEEIDPLSCGSGPALQEVERTRGGSSDAQIGFLVSLGVERTTAAGYTRRQASAVIEKLKATRCTIKQKTLLEKYGEDTSVNFETASRIIDEISRNNWQPRTRTEQ